MGQSIDLIQIENTIYTATYAGTNTDKNLQAIADFLKNADPASIAQVIHQDDMGVYTFKPAMSDQMFESTVNQTRLARIVENFSEKLEDVNSMLIDAEGMKSADPENSYSKEAIPAFKAQWLQATGEDYTDPDHAREIISQYENCTLEPRVEQATAFVQTFQL